LNIEKLIKIALFIVPVFVMLFFFTNCNDFNANNDISISLNSLSLPDFSGLATCSEGLANRQRSTNFVQSIFRNIPHSNTDDLDSHFEQSNREGMQQVLTKKGTGILPG